MVGEVLFFLFVLAHWCCLTAVLCLVLDFLQLNLTTDNLRIDLSYLYTECRHCGYAFSSYVISLGYSLRATPKIAALILIIVCGCVYHNCRHDKPTITTPREFFCNIHEYA